MSTQSFPTLTRTAPTVVNFALIPNTQIFTSPINRSTQTLELPGARWRAKMEYRNVLESDARILKAFFAKLRGASGRFYLADMSHKTPAGTALGSGIVKGAAESGSSISTDGWTANQTSLLLPGDYVGIGGELKIITTAISSDGTGNATITFEPPLRSTPADNSAIVVTMPTCIMRLENDEQDQVDIDPERCPSITINCVETF